MGRKMSKAHLTTLALCFTQRKAQTTSRFTES